MAGGPSTYIVGGMKFPSRFLAVGSLAAWGGLFYLATSGGGKKEQAPVAQKVQSLDKEEAEFVKNFMAELEKEGAAKAH